MAEKKYLDLTGLGQYDGKIKEWVNDRIDTEAYDDSAILGLHANKTEGEGKQTVAQEVAAGITALDLTNTYEAKDAKESRIAALEGKHAEGKTVAQEAADAVAAVVDEAPEAFDTLKEIAEWIGTGNVENTTAAAMLTDVEALKTQVGKAAVPAQGTEGEEGYVAPVAATGLVARIDSLEAVNDAADTYVAITEAEIAALFATE